MNEIKKEELLKPSKWIRLLFMVVYSLIIEIIALPLILILIFLQFLFHLIAGSPNNQIKNITNWLISFLTESFEYLTYKTEQKPFPFDQDDEVESNDDVEEITSESTDNLTPEEEIIPSEAETKKRERKVSSNSSEYGRNGWIFVK